MLLGHLSMMPDVAHEARGGRWHLSCTSDRVALLASLHVGLSDNNFVQRRIRHWSPDNMQRTVGSSCHVPAGTLDPSRLPPA